VVATATQGGLVAPAEPGQPRPATLTGTSATREAAGTTDDDGVAAFWWQPDVAQRPSDVLSVLAKDAPAAPIVVTAHRAIVGEGGGRTGGLHITEVRFSTGQPFDNDEFIKFDNLASGIEIDLDGPVVGASVQGKPVIRVLLDLPWPIRGDGETWSDEVIGTRTMQVDGRVDADGSLLLWNPTDLSQAWLRGRLPEVLRRVAPNRQVVGRLEVDGWAIVSEADPSQHLNGHVSAFVDGDQTRYALPTDDEVTGGRYVQWFRLG
jgi:hypothetical protein